MKKILLITVLAALYNLTMAGGFQINEQGAKALAMANAFTGIANNPTAIFFNPAGITQLQGTHFTAGLSLIAPTTKFTGPSPATTEWEMEKQVFTPFDVYITHQFDENWYVGLSVNNQYGLGTKWPDDWAGNQLAVDTRINSFFFTPVVAYKFSDQFSLSAGAVIAYADVKIINHTVHPLTLQPTVEITLKGNKLGYGFNAGLMYKPVEQLKLGLSYRSEVKFDFDGTATSNPAGFTHPLLQVYIPFPNGDITAPLTTPQNITFGIGITPTPELTLGADFQYVGWSSYDKLEITFKTYDLSPTTPGVQNVRSAERNYKNTFIIRGGAEYKTSDAFALRAGVYFDKNPVKTEYVEPILPDANRIGLNVGFGYMFTEKFGVDFGYLLLLFADRKVTGSEFGFNGTYKNMSHIFALDLSYSL
ncbi:MAG TPA: OmpP1/FadL family transporter [Ignavibacteriaceae bacterium]|nr:OmpP1/FadL family transporter [Ignavibacteriaceae bacterium]